MKRARAVSGAKRVLLALPLTLSLTGCLTGHLYEKTSKPSSMRVPKDPDVDRTTVWQPPEEYINVPLSSNVLGFLLFVGPTLAWDLVTAPVQITGGFYPYGRRLAPG